MLFNKCDAPSAYEGADNGEIEHGGVLWCHSSMGKDKRSHLSWIVAKQKCQLDIFHFVLCIISTSQPCSGRSRPPSWEAPIIGSVMRTATRTLCMSWSHISRGLPSTPFQPPKMALAVIFRTSVPRSKCPPCNVELSPFQGGTSKGIFLAASDLPAPGVPLDGWAIWDRW